IYWVDIDSGRLFRADHATLVHECFYRGPVIGGFTFQEDGSLLLFEANRIAVLEPNGRRRVIADGIDPDMSRFNDVIADPEGRVYAGTIGKSLGSGGVYRVDRDAKVTCLWKGTGCANGMGFSHDLKQFLWTCSTRRFIERLDYDRASGALTNPARVYQAPEEEGIPDGMTLDNEDNLWTARWDGGSVLVIDRNGKLRDKLTIPVPRVSSATFGGPDLDHLYVTTASLGEPGEAGTLYRVKVPARGRPPFRSRIRL
ncbi:MAG TPA: SMP-30/gluconolactonase/LRE family protein, partial [Polyangiaceae bacterium]